MKDDPKIYDDFDLSAAAFEFHKAFLELLLRLSEQINQPL